MSTSEKQRLDDIANNSIYARGISKTTQQYCCDIFLRYMIPGTVLELGPAEGLMTDILFPKFSDDYTVVDGGTKFIDQIKKRHPAITAVCSIFEEFIPPPRKYDNIILGHVLEHVTDPVEILCLCGQWLSDNGRILAAVPNKNSIHRQAAVEMGLLSKLDDFSEKDKRHGHRRVFGHDSFVECFDNARLKIIKSGGYWLKPFSDSQIETWYDDKMIDSFLKLGEQYPNIAAEIYIVAENNT